MAGRINNVITKASSILPIPLILNTVGQDAPPPAMQIRKMPPSPRRCALLYRRNSHSGVAENTLSHPGFAGRLILIHIYI